MHCQGTLLRLASLAGNTQSALFALADPSEISIRNDSNIVKLGNFVATKCVTFMTHGIMNSCMYIMEGNDPDSDPNQGPSGFTHPCSIFLRATARNFNSSDPFFNG